MTRKRSLGLCRLFRTRAIGRVAVQLCLFLLMANLVAPLAWATSHGGASTDGFVLCHAVTPGGTADRDQPADHQNDQMMPQCPLCLVYGGSIWVPPSSAPEIVRSSRFGDESEPEAADDDPRSGQPFRLRPSPTGPPASA